MDAIDYELNKMEKEFNLNIKCEKCIAWRKEFIEILRKFNMKVGTNSKGDWQREINKRAGEMFA